MNCEALCSPEASRGILRANKRVTPKGQVLATIATIPAHDLSESKREITQQVKEAMLGACDDTLNFTDEPSAKFSAEYIFTVSVAKAVNRLNGPPGDPYKIFVEKSTKQFSLDCLPPVIFGHPFSKTRRSTTFRPQALTKKELGRIQNGRIDVAVYVDIPNNGYLGMQPLCAIEVKGFNPSRKLVLEDLKRNLAFFRIAGDTSVLGFSIFAALHSYNRYADEEQIKKNEHETKLKYERWLSELGSTEGMEIGVETFTVRKEIVGRVLDEGEYKVLDTDARHHFVGVIIHFLRS
jgi:hypothetical protein